RGIVPDHVDCVYIRQAEALGLGHAVLCARNIVGDEPFYVVLADDLVFSRGKSCLAQMGEQHARVGGSVIAVQEVPREHVSRYGIVDGEQVGERLRRLTGIVEKPAPDVAPSTSGVIGRYLLSPRIFELLESTPKGAGGEIQLTDAIARLLKEEPVHSYHFEGKRYDCGDKLGYLEATMELALEHPELGERFRAYLTNFLRSIKEPA